MNIAKGKKALNLRFIEAEIRKIFNDEHDEDIIKTTLKVMVQTTSANQDNKYIIKDNMVSKRVFEEIMNIHAAFTAVDYNMDHVLDRGEIRMLLEIYE